MRAGKFKGKEIFAWLFRIAFVTFLFAAWFRCMPHPIASLLGLFSFIAIAGVADSKFGDYP